MLDVLAPVRGVRVRPGAMGAKAPHKPRARMPFSVEASR